MLHVKRLLNHLQEPVQFFLGVKDHDNKWWSRYQFSSPLHFHSVITWLYGIELAKNGAILLTFTLHLHSKCTCKNVNMPYIFIVSQNYKWEYRILQFLGRYWTPYGTEQCRIKLLKLDYALDSCGLNPAEIMSCCCHCYHILNGCGVQPVSYQQVQVCVEMLQTFRSPDPDSELSCSSTTSITDEARLECGQNSMFYTWSIHSHFTWIRGPSNT